MIGLCALVTNGHTIAKMCSQNLISAQNQPAKFSQSQNMDSGLQLCTIPSKCCKAGPLQPLIKATLAIIYWGLAIIHCFHFIMQLHGKHVSVRHVQQWQWWGTWIINGIKTIQNASEQPCTKCTKCTNMYIMFMMCMHALDPCTSHYITYNIYNPWKHW